MIEEKLKLSGNLSVKQPLNGDLNNSVIYVDPITQEKVVTPTRETQEIVPDKGFTGLSKVKVKGYTVKTASKVITENGTYNASDEELVGYDKVKVSISNSQFTGHYDREGLKQIGWSDEEIDYYQQNGVQWNDSEDDVFKLSSKELLGDNSSETRFLPKNTTKTYFKDYYRLMAIPNINNVTSSYNMFNYCYSLTAIPLLDTSKVTNMGSMFSGCSSLTTIPLLDTSKVTNMGSMFSGCSSLKTILLLDTSKVTYMSSMFSGCSSLTAIPLLDTSKVTNISSMFRSCYSLTAIPLLDTSKVTNMTYMFSDCYSLTDIPLLNCESVVSVYNMFSNCSNLTNLEGFSNLGEAYSTTTAANYGNYTLNISSSTKYLTEQSLINILTNLYDIATKGCNTQKIQIGSANIAKLTSEEGQAALTSATEKGWTIS